MRRSRSFLLAALTASMAVMTASGCDSEEAPVGLPHCEPPRELKIERLLKQGYRALVDGDTERARASFADALELDGAHPEALAAAKTARRDKGIAPSTARGRGALVIAGQEVPVEFPVNHQRYRFEELRAMKELAKTMGIDERKAPVPRYYRPRTFSPERQIDPKDRASVVRAVDLVVLHDTKTRTAREAFVSFEDTGLSTHFFIDWDGTIYQTLDLALEASHAGASTDPRSVAIELVNPVEMTDKHPLPPEAQAAGVRRPLSEFVEIQGQQRQQWGYTDAQFRSLESLVRALLRQLPGITPRLPRDPQSGGIPRKYSKSLRSFVGVLGHLHLAPTLVDPGAGFDWERLADAIR